MWPLCWGMGWGALEKRSRKAFRYLEITSGGFQGDEGAVPIDLVVCRTMEGEGFRYTADRIEGKSIIYRKEPRA